MIPRPLCHRHIHVHPPVLLWHAPWHNERFLRLKLYQRVDVKINNVQTMYWTCSFWYCLHEASIVRIPVMHPTCSCDLLPLWNLVVLLFMFAFKSWGSMHTVRSPFFFLTQTIKFTQSVGSSTFLIIPRVVILLSSFFSFSFSGAETLLGAWTTGWASSLSCILEVNGRAPSPLKTSSNLRTMSFAVSCFFAVTSWLLMQYTLFTSPHFS